MSILDAVATTGCISAIGIVGLISRRVGAYKGRPGWRSWLHRWLSISLAVFAVAALAGCDSGHTAEKSAAPAVGPVASTGTTAGCVTSAAKGNCGPYRYPAITHSNGHNTYVGQDVWNTIPGWSQTLNVTDPGNWNVTAKIPAGNTSVVSYPNTGQNIDWINGAPPPLSSWSSIYSSFSENLAGDANSGSVAEAAYDIWLNNWANEVMIQTDFVGDAMRPRCSGSQVIATVPFGGSGGVPAQNWNLCQFGSELIWQFPTGTNESSGSVDMLAMLTWLEDNGKGKYLPRNSGLTALSFGFEICSTGGQPETFRLSHFSIRAA